MHVVFLGALTLARARYTDCRFCRCRCRCCCRREHEQPKRKCAPLESPGSWPATSVARVAADLAQVRRRGRLCNLLTVLLVLLQTLYAQASANPLSTLDATVRYRERAGYLASEKKNGRCSPSRRAGVGCSGRDGGSDFTGGQACCGGGVRALNRVCSSTVGAPCVVSDGHSDGELHT